MYTLLSNCFNMKRVINSISMYLVGRILLAYENRVNNGYTFVIYV